MASGQTIADYAAFDLDLPDSGGPLPDRLNGREMLRFGSAADQTAYTRPRFMPYGLSTGDFTVTVRLCWETASTDAGAPVRWRIALERYNTPLDQEDFGTEKVVVDTPFADDAGDNPRPHVARYTDIVFTITEADSIGPGDMFRVRITRESFSGTTNDDAELLGVLVFES